MSEPTSGLILHHQTGKEVGCFFLLDERHVATCSHVIIAASPEGLENYQDVEVELRFRSWPDKAKAKVVILLPPRKMLPEPVNYQSLRTADIAVLQILDESFGRARKFGLPWREALLAREKKLKAQSKFHIFGPTAGGVHVMGEGTPNEINGHFILHTEVRDVDFGIVGGFSGSPVLDGQGICLGMCVEAHKGSKQGQMIPSTAIYEVAADHGMEPWFERPNQVPHIDWTDYDILKGWEKPLKALHATRQRLRGQRRKMILLVVSCDSEHCPGLFVKRVMYQMAAECGDEAIWPCSQVRWRPTAKHWVVGEAITEYNDRLAANEPIRRSETAITNALNGGYKAIHLSDVHLSKERERQLAAEILSLWGEACLSMYVWPQFMAVVTTPEPLRPDTLNLFKAALRAEGAFVSCELGPFEKFQVEQLEDWGVHVFGHERTRSAETFQRNAKTHVYQQRKSMTVMEWSEGYGRSKNQILERS